MSDKSTDRYKSMIPKPSVHDELIDSTNPNTNDNLPDSIDVNVSTIPVAKKKRNIRETHKTKAFYIRHEIAKLIEKDIRNSSRGDMTKIVNALFEEYYKSQGKLK